MRLGPNSPRFVRRHSRLLPGRCESEISFRELLTQSRTTIEGLPGLRYESFVSPWNIRGLGHSSISKIPWARGSSIPRVRDAPGFGVAKADWSTNPPDENRAFRKRVNLEMPP